MIRLRARYNRRPDDGVAMLFVIGIGLVVSLFIVAMLATVLQNQTTTRVHRNITSAQSAAEAGLGDAIYKLAQYNGSGNTNWSTLPAQWTKTNPNTATFGTNADYSVWLTPMSDPTKMIVWAKGNYGGNTKTVRAVVTQGFPPAFDYSLFASVGIDIHHHSSWLSPQVWTTAVHSNGYINLDYSSEFTVNTMEAVGTLQFEKGGGKTPGLTIPTTGYNWYDALSNRCFPGAIDQPAGTPPPGTVDTSSSIQCTGAPQYSGQATIYGTVQAGSVSMNGRGQVKPVPAAFNLPDTGQQINQAAGDIYAGSAKIGGATYTTTSAGASCTACNKGAGVGAGQVSGALKITPGYAPPTIAFPSIDYSTTYRVQAQSEQTATGVQHVFSSSSEFFTYITNPANGFYRAIDAAATPGSVGHPLKTWSKAVNGAPQVIFLDGTFDITGNGLQLNWGDMQKMVNSATGTSGAAPVLVIRGNLVVEGGGIKLNAPLVMAGTGNRTDFLVPGTSTSPVSIDVKNLLDPNAIAPAVLAAGGSIDSSDYDTDSPWTASATYEPAKAAPVYIRGLVYSGKWDANSKTSLPQNQHWHNYDPKNLMKIYGAQVGGTLHDCNDFSFSYDPLVRKAFGFGGGTIKVIDYQELGT